MEIFSMNLYLYIFKLDLLWNISFLDRLLGIDGLWLLHYYGKWFYWSITIKIVPSEKVIISPIWKRKYQTENIELRINNVVIIPLPNSGR